MGSSTIGQTLGTLRASREQADLLLERAAADAARIERDGAERARENAAARLREIEELRAAIAAHAAQVEIAATRMAEAMAEAAGKLVELARESEFSAPEWPGPGTRESAS